MKLTAISLALLTAASANAADWSDSYVSLSHGSKYREPANPNDVAKTVVSFTYLGGNSLGSNFFNADLLRSDDKDPANNGTSGAQEVYVVYANTLSFSKLGGSPVTFGPVRDVALHNGFDYSAKNDAFGGAVWKLMVGPKVEFNVPGFLSLGLFAYKERGNNSLAGQRVNFDVTYRLATVWQFDVSLGAPAVFKGWANYTGTKGKDGFGNDTHPETWIETSLLWDVGSVAGAAPKKYYAGIGYQYIKNKFNNASSLTGTKVSAPSLRFEAHF